MARWHLFLSFDFAPHRFRLAKLHFGLGLVAQARAPRRAASSVVAPLSRCRHQRHALGSLDLMTQEEQKPFLIKDIEHVSFDIPMSVQRRIGATVIAFSRLEHTAELLIWHLLNLDGDRAKTITGRLETSRKTQLLKELLIIQKFSDPFWEKFWQATNITTEARNKVAHGVWFTYFGQPCIISTRWKSASNTFTAERFPVERIGAIQRLSGRLDSMLSSWGERLGAQTAKWSQPPGKGSPTPREGLE
jgi:hypothetical protein